MKYVFGIRIVLHAHMSALSEGHLTVVNFCVSWGYSFVPTGGIFFPFPPHSPLFSLFCGFLFVLLVKEIPVLRGGLIFLLVLYFR